VINKNKKMEESASSSQSSGKPVKGYYFGQYTQWLLQKSVDWATKKLNVSKELDDIQIVMEEEDEATKKSHPATENPVVCQRKVKFAHLVSAVFLSKSFNTDQLEKIWESAKELTKEQAAEVLVPIIRKVKQESTELRGTELDDEKSSFIETIDFVFSGNEITRDQLEFIATTAANLPTDTLLEVIASVLGSHYQKREEAKKVKNFKDFFLNLSICHFS
jgi:hypothetical protein